MVRVDSYSCSVTIPELRSCWYILTTVSRRRRGRLTVAYGWRSGARRAHIVGIDSWFGTVRSRFIAMVGTVGGSGSSSWDVIVPCSNSTQDFPASIFKDTRFRRDCTTGATHALTVMTSTIFDSTVFTQEEACQCATFLDESRFKVSEAAITRMGWKHNISEQSAPTDKDGHRDDHNYNEDASSVCNTGVSEYFSQCFCF